MKERIEYIDAMRGVVMLLVVMWHAKLYSINLYDTFSLNDVFFLILMPAFFFISGFVGSGRWKGARYLAMLPPTLFFMILWGYQAGWSLHRLFFDVSKGGFWFTILLPCYFLIYSILRLCLTKGFKISEKPFSIIHVTVGLLIYLGTAFLVSPFNPFRNDTLNGLFSVVHFRYYLFFAIGTTAAAFREKFLEWSRNPWASAGAIAIFLAGCCVYFNIEDKLWQTLLLLLIGWTGTQILFSFFQKWQKTFSKETRTGRMLQYIGVRTLDIYLLHLFLLPIGMDFIGEYFCSHPSPLLEAGVTFIIASLTIAGCLIVSKLIRTSDILAKGLFGKVIE